MTEQIDAVQHALSRVYTTTTTTHVIALGTTLVPGREYFNLCIVQTSVKKPHGQYVLVRLLSKVDVTKIGYFMVKMPKEGNDKNEGKQKGRLCRAC